MLPSDLDIFLKIGQSKIMKVNSNGIKENLKSQGTFPSLK